MPTTKHRVTVNLPDAEYGELAALSEQHNVSMAWIGQKAITQFLEAHRENPVQLPLTFTQRPERPKWPASDGPR